MDVNLTSVVGDTDSDSWLVVAQKDRSQSVHWRYQARVVRFATTRKPEAGPGSHTSQSFVGARSQGPPICAA